MIIFTWLKSFVIYHLKYNKALAIHCKLKTIALKISYLEITEKLDLIDKIRNVVSNESFNVIWPMHCKLIITLAFEIMT